jgi:hypothetical protein
MREGPMSTETMPAPISDDRVLEQLEAEFLRSPGFWPSPSELDLAEMLDPAIGRSDFDPVCRTTRIRSRYGGCCG